jgi:hypothetical protein
MKEINTEGEATNAAPAGHSSARPVRDRATNERRPVRQHPHAAAAAAVGAYFFAVGAHLLPIPGGPSNLHGPSWLVLCVGLAFLLAGVALLIQTLGHANTAGELPAEAQRWLRAVQYLIGFRIFCCFGAIASWIAFGPGERHFSGTIMVGGAAINAAIGRTAFGVATMIIWLCTAAVTRAG